MKHLKLAMVALMVSGAAVAAPKKPAPKAPAAPVVKQLAPTEAPKAIQTASVDLGAEFPQMKGYVFTQGVNIIQPGTGRALHSHVSAPEIVRILSGTLTEARNGGPPIKYGPGSTLVNAAGVQHTWANLGTEPVVFVSSAITQAPEAPAAPASGQ